jgi:hypothetical protein
MKKIKSKFSNKSNENIFKYYLILDIVSEF